MPNQEGCANISYQFRSIISVQTWFKPPQLPAAPPPPPPRPPPPPHPNIHTFSFPTDRSEAVVLLQFVCLCVYGSYVAFVLRLFVPHLSFFWYFRRAVLLNCTHSLGIFTYFCNCGPLLCLANSHFYSSVFHRLRFSVCQVGLYSTCQLLYPPSRITVFATPSKTQLVKVLMHFSSCAKGLLENNKENIIFLIGDVFVTQIIKEKV